MDWGLLQGAGTRGIALEQSHCPLIPDLRIGVVAPDLDLNYLPLANDDRHADREVEWEPRLHRRRMLLWLDAVENILVQFSREVASESMQLSLRLLDSEAKAAIFTQ